METNKICCKNCIHFVQHYGLFKYGYKDIFCGHCLIQNKYSSHINPTFKCKNFKQINNSQKIQENIEYIDKKYIKILKELTTLNMYIAQNKKRG